MVKGVAVKFGSYSETVPKILKVIGFDREIKKHPKILLKPDLMTGIKGASTNVNFVEEVLKFCMEHKNPATDIFIVEGVDSGDTEEVFEKLGYRSLGEKYGIGLVDLNYADTESVTGNFLRFDEIQYPLILKDSFLVSLPVLKGDDELELAGSLSNMLGAFPAKSYRGFFSSRKNKIRRWDIKYSIHDINQIKKPDFCMIDGSEKGVILAGQPLEMDKQAAKILGFDWKEIGYLRLFEEEKEKDKDKSVDELIGA